VGQTPLVEGDIVMKMNYLFAIATIVAVALFPSQVVLKGLVGVATWKGAVCLGIWTRILPTTSLVLPSSLWANRVILFLVTHATGCLVKFLSLIVA
jgi:hypothetical protein